MKKWDFRQIGERLPDTRKNESRRQPLCDGAGWKEQLYRQYFIPTSDKMSQSHRQKTPRFPRHIPYPVGTVGAPCGNSPRERA